MHKIGILGGTFDPVHTGHLLLAEWVLDSAGLDEVWLIPAGRPYKKAGRQILPGEERLHMAELAAQGNPRLRCMDTELVRDGYTYTYETLEQLCESYPENKFYFIMGADCLFSIENWRKPEVILQHATLIAAVRDAVPMEELQAKASALREKFGGEILLMPFLRFSVSSSEIRERVAEGKSIRYLVPDAVLAYIQEKGVYRG